MEENGFIHIFLIWLIPASIELSIAYLMIRVVREAERRSRSNFPKAENM